VVTENATPPPTGTHGLTGEPRVNPPGRVLHCWEDLRNVTDNWDLPNATCMLPDGHDGPHEWTPDSDIRVQFK
jgi:hypothetical protein